MSICIINSDIKNDIELLKGILNRNRKSLVNRRRFEWLYLENPRGKARAWYVLDGQTENPIAFTSVLPRMVRVNGQDILCWCCADFSVDKRYRTLGVALKLRREAKKHVDCGTIAALYAHPNAKMQVVHQRVGHTCIGTMKRYVKVLKSENYLQRHIKYNSIVKFFSFWINRGFSVIDYFLIRDDKAYTAEWIENVRFTWEYDDLFDEIASFYKIIGDRSASYLNWRYHENPLYSSSRIVVRKNGVLRGYVIFSQKENGVVNIKDMACLPKEIIVKIMLKKLFRELRRKNVQSVSFVLKENNPLIPFLVKAGFRQRSDRSLIFAHVGGGTDLEKLWLNGDNWFMTVGDRDV